MRGTSMRMPERVGDAGKPGIVRGRAPIVQLFPQIRQDGRMGWVGGEIDYLVRIRREIVDVSCRRAPCDNRLFAASRAAFLYRLARKNCVHRARVRTCHWYANTGPCTSLIGWSYKKTRLRSPE
jgi:hypothetical protein